MHDEIRTDSLELRVALDHLGLMEERDERLVCGLDEHELERVAVERDALQGAEDGVEGGAARDCT